jgi:hypothetical protein
MQVIDTALLQQPIQGVNLSAPTLEEQMGSSLSMLVFLRHFGCMLTRELVQDIRVMAERNPFVPQPIFIYQGSAQSGQAFFDQYWPQARAVADKDLSFFKAFGLKNGSFLQLFGPKAWQCHIRAFLKGNTMGLPTGNPFLLSGIFMVQHNLVLWEYYSHNVGDHPDFELLAEYPEFAESIFTAAR